MRKSRFLLNLMVATALGLSTIGCGSSGSGGGPIAGPGPSTEEPPEVREQRALRQYLLVGQRGLTAFAPTFGPGQSGPDGLNLVASPGDGDNVDPAQLYEILVQEGSPFRWQLTGPGQDGPTTPTVADDTAGFHEVHFDPRGEYAIGLSRAHNRGYGDDPVVSSTQQIFEVRMAEPLTEQFPPTFELVPTAETQSIALYHNDQGDFMSGAWSPDGRHFYVSVGQRDLGGGTSSFIIGYSLDRLTGRLDAAGDMLFSSSGGGEINNAAQLMFVGSSQLLALDNANGRVVAYSRDSGSGELTELTSVATPSDPRGMAIDRDGRYLYVLGRESGALAGYRLSGSGLEQIEVTAGLGPIAWTLGEPGGDVVTSPNADHLYLGLYNGTMVSLSIDPGTGLLEQIGSTRLLGGSRNLTNLEVDTTGQFVFAASEHDHEAFQSYVTVGNGFPYNEPPQFANLDETTNDVNPTSSTPMVDSFGRVVYVDRSMGRAFTGDVQGLRVETQGTLRAESRVEVENPYGLSIMRKLVVEPVDPET